MTNPAHRKRQPDQSDVSDRLVQLLAAGRALFGLTLLVSPLRMGWLMWGTAAGGASSRMFARGGGSRDLALGVATAVRPRRLELLWLSAACDAADCLVTVIDSRDVPRTRRIVIASGAATMALAHALLAHSARRAG